MVNKIMQEFVISVENSGFTTRGENHMPEQILVTLIRDHCLSLITPNPGQSHSNLNTNKI